MFLRRQLHPEDQRAGALDREHEDHRARQDLQDGLGAGQPERRADGQPIHERDPAPQQAYGQHQGDEKAQTAHLHQQQDDPLAQPGEIGAGGKDGQTRDGRGGGGGEQRIHEGDGARGHPRQQQQHGADADQRRPTRPPAGPGPARGACGAGRSPSRSADRHWGRCSLPKGRHGRDATSRSFSRWPTANSVSPASSLVSALGQGIRRSDRWIRSTVTS